MPTKITIRNFGSLHVEGDFELYDEEGNKYDLAGRTKVKLCRCGQSKTKPFCDSFHRTIGWNAECKAYALEPPKTAA